MPTYEYLCDACEHRFERFQRITDRRIRTCPSCGERSVRRLISPGGGVVFRGPGFYATDYRKDSGPSSTDDKGPGPSAGGAGGKKAGEKKAGEEKTGGA